MSGAKQPWLYSACFDGLYILSPPFFVCAAVMCAPSLLVSLQNVPLWAWVVLVMGIDVSHVYSTLFRTYFDPQEMRERKMLYLTVPVLCWFCGVVLYSMGALVFWRVLAYIAVFHFVRQQYGFMMIYRRGEWSEGKFARRLDQGVIYAATLYPLIYWHTHLPRHFSWFIDGDFVGYRSPAVAHAALAIYLALLLLYVSKECAEVKRLGRINIPKNLLLLGTALSWYIGIVIYNGDMAFTLTNVITHGIPYMALVWAYGRKKWWRSSAREMHFAIKRFFTLKAIPLFIGVLVLFAYLEEALWDGFVWREHGGFFRGWHALPDLSHSPILVWLVPLLAVPQATHYIVDGFIWKMRKPDTGFKELLHKDGGETAAQSA